MKKKILVISFLFLACISSVFAWGKKKNVKKDPVEELKKQLVGNCYNGCISYNLSHTSGEEMHVAFLDDSYCEEILFCYSNIIDHSGSSKKVKPYSFLDNGDGSFVFYRSSTAAYHYTKVWWDGGKVKEIWLVKSPKDTVGLELTLCKEKKDWYPNDSAVKKFWNGRTGEYIDLRSSLHGEKFPE